MGSCPWFADGVHRNGCGCAEEPSASGLPCPECGRIGNHKNGCKRVLGKFRAKTTKPKCCKTWRARGSDHEYHMCEIPLSGTVDNPVAHPGSCVCSTPGCNSTH